MKRTARDIDEEKVKETTGEIQNKIEEQEKG